MIEIVEIDELNPGDIILIEGIGDNDICAVTVKSITEDNLIIPEEFGGIDVSPEDPYQIVRIGTKEEKPKIIVLYE